MENACIPTLNKSLVENNFDKELNFACVENESVMRQILTQITHLSEKLEHQEKSIFELKKGHCDPRNILGGSKSERACLVQSTSSADDDILAREGRPPRQASLNNSGSNIELDVLPEFAEQTGEYIDIDETNIKVTKEKPEDEIGDVSTDEVNKFQFVGLVKQCIESSTLHGLPRLVDSSIWIRVLWVLAMTGAITALAIQLVGLTTEYLSFNVITTVDVKEGNMTFPAITVCNNRRFLTSKLLSLPRFSDLTPAEDDVSEIVKNLRYMDQRLTPTERLDLGANASDTIDVWTDRIPSITALPYYGSCFKIDYPEEGRYVDIGFRLNINDSIDLFPTEAGITVYLMDHQLAHHTYKPVQTIHIKQGTLSSVVISHDVINRLSGRYDECHDDEEEFIARSGVAYGQGACKFECEFRFILSECKCIYYTDEFIPFWLKTVNESGDSYPMCYSDSDIRCVSIVEVSEYRINECDCKPSCHMKVYRDVGQQNTNLADFDCIEKPEATSFCAMADHLAYKAGTKLTKNYVKNFAAVRITLTEEPYKIYTQVPAYPLLRFLADIGGTMGFYLGASMLTYFEIVELFVSSCVYGLTCVWRRIRTNTI